MDGIIDVLSLFIGSLLIIILLITMICILLISSVYFILWLHDLILGDLLFKILEKGAISNKRLIKKKSVELKNILFPEDACLRYETPLFSFCFSYITLYLIYYFLPITNGVLRAFASMNIFSLVYLLGMRRKYKGKACYDEVLEENLSFFKLSFIPLTFCFSIAGFVIGIYGTFKDEFNNCNVLDDVASYFKIIKDNMTLTEGVNGIGFSNVIFLIEILIVLCFLLYIASIPLQLMTYFFIQIILYFRKNKTSYHKAFKGYLKIVDDNIPKI